MFWITVSLLLLMGFIAASEHLGRSVPALRDVGRALRPHEGWIGVIGALWGLWGVLNMLINIRVITVAPIYWIFGVLVAVLLTLLGLVLGLPLIAKLFGGELGSKLDAQHRKLVVRRASLGTSGLITAALSIVLNIFN